MNSGNADSKKPSTGFTFIKSKQDKVIENTTNQENSNIINSSTDIFSNMNFKSNNQKEKKDGFSFIKVKKPEKESIFDNLSNILLKN